MSRAGRPWGKRQARKLLKTLKQKELEARAYSTMAEVAADAEEFIEQVYHSVRLRSALAYQSPVEFEQQQAQEKARAWMPVKMSLSRHLEIYSDVSDPLVPNQKVRNCPPRRAGGRQLKPTC